MNFLGIELDSQKGVFVVGTDFAPMCPAEPMKIGRRLHDH